MPNISEFIPFENPLGEKVYEMERTERMSLAYVIITGRSASHKHPFEEIYFITKGKGKLFIRDTQRDTWKSVSPGDSYNIQKDTFHHLENTGTEPLELVVVCSPPYDHSKVTYEPT
jgi:mannose-6-phosphate isomerase-like protein (cupin superfamily)